MTTTVDLTDQLERYRRILRIRRFEERIAELYRDGAVPGFVHLSVGQEATAVGATWPLRPDDFITSTHRGHGHVLAKGLNITAAFAELMARDHGTCRGRGGSMHLADPALGILGANGIVAGGLPIAAGAGLAARLRDDGRVVVAFFGDGAVAQGAFHEAANLAAVWDLPVIFCCENNHYAEFSLTDDQHPAPFGARAAGYGLPYHRVAGNDVEEVTAVISELVEKIRAGGGPVFVESETHRRRGHYEGDPQKYRDDALDSDWNERDPLTVARRALLSAGAGAEQLATVEREVETEISEAERQALAAPAPDDATLFDFLTAPRPPLPEPPVPAAGDEVRFSRAIRAALEHELETDPAVVVFGVDVGAGGGVFGITRGLHDRWPDRVRDTPISEAAVIGAGVGAAMAGLRPVVELMYLDFIGVCLDQLLNQAAKLRFMTGGAAEVPLVVRTQFAAGRSSGSQHSQSLEALLAHIPGLTVVMPSTVADTYGLLRAAVRDPNPVVFIENRLLYEKKGLMPPADHLVPIGKARIARPGRDVTVVSWSRMVHDCLAAADTVAADGIDVEVIDLRTISPLDRTAVLESVTRTGRLLIAHEAVTDFGAGAELAAVVADEAFWALDAPVRRVGAPFLPAPYAPNLERLWLPDRDRIAGEIRRLVAT
ncbi:MAG TPA: pyruvate dehydrogenase complex E1 component subunit beta [Acidimicrobiia bacterium]|nr:pyruvate dehydrogenase complex E1 component subunit beta [Acidimicrobiia bacterium]